MPSLAFDADEVVTLLDLLGIRDAYPGSALRHIRVHGRGLHPDDPRMLALEARKFIYKPPRARKWRVNSVLAGALTIAAHPEELITLKAGDTRIPPVTWARRGTTMAECTVGAKGLTKLSVPLGRPMIVTLILSALSGPGPEGTPSGFHFLGRPEDAFALTAVVREWRATGGLVTVQAAKARIADDVSKPLYVVPFMVTGGPDAFEDLRTNPKAVEASLGRLAMAGHVRFEATRLLVADELTDVLGLPGIASFTLTRSDYVDGQPVGSTLTVFRAGDHRLVFRTRKSGDGQRQVEWLDLDRRRLRQLVALHLALPDKLAEVAAAGSS